MASICQLARLPGYSGLGDASSTRSAPSILPALLLPSPTEASIITADRLLRAIARKGLKIGGVPRSSSLLTSVCKGVGKLFALHVAVSAARFRAVGTSSLLRTVAGLGKEDAVEAHLEAGPEFHESLKALQNFAEAHKQTIRDWSVDVPMLTPQKLQDRVNKLLGSPPVVSREDAAYAPIGTLLLHLMLVQLRRPGLQPALDLPERPPGSQSAVSGSSGGEDLNSLLDENIKVAGAELLSFQNVMHTTEPVYGPCVAPPMPWASPYMGAYQLADGKHCFNIFLARVKDISQRRMLMDAHRSALARGRREQRRQQKQAVVGGTAHAFEDDEGQDSEHDDVRTRDGLAHIYKALDVLGSQGWKINEDVLQVVLAVHTTHKDVAAIPDPGLDKTPGLPRSKVFHPCVISFVRTDMTPPRQVSTSLELTAQPLSGAALRTALLVVNQAKKEKAEATSLRAMLHLQLKVALKHEHYSAIYFPHNLDFRGRAYPLAPHLNHMGNDLCRGLLLFSEARPLGRHGFTWLLIHLANLYAVVDKKAFTVRREWTLRHLPDVLDSAERPLSGRQWWLGAENPWSALATCMDIRAALLHGDLETYESRLPVHQDGTCNGLQHYAALGRDEPGARAVNMLDASEPADVYSSVTQKLREIVYEASQQDGRDAALARTLLPHIDRKLVKQTVMTTVYGVTKLGARDQIRNRLMDKGFPRDLETQRLAMYAADQTLKAVQGLFGRASDIMDWMKQCVSVVCSTGETVRWTTPLGLPVSQPYYKPKKLAAHIMTFDLKVKEDGDFLPNQMKQRSAFPPNYIHSLDASHMMMTAVSCRESGMAFAGVHDSFWTHACDVPQCRHIIRQQFVLLYEQELLAHLHRDLQQITRSAGLASQHVEQSRMLQEKLEELKPPEVGKLALEDILRATYFFN